MAPSHFYLYTFIDLSWIRLLYLRFFPNPAFISSLVPESFSFRLNNPYNFLYILNPQSLAKDHGRQNQIEGKLNPGEPVVVVEDLISTGGSVIDCVKVLEENGAKVLGVVSIFTYGMEKGKKRLSEANVVNHSLCDLDSLLPVAVAKGYIEKEEEAKLLRFRDNPSDESWMRE